MRRKHDPHYLLDVAVRLEGARDAEKALASWARPAVLVAAARLAPQSLHGLRARALLFAAAGMPDPDAAQNRALLDVAELLANHSTNDVWNILTSLEPSLTATLDQLEATASSLPGSGLARHEAVVMRLSRLVGPRAPKVHPVLQSEAALVDASAFVVHRLGLRDHLGFRQTVPGWRD